MLSATDRKVWMFALSWSARWYEAAIGADSTWLVLLLWIGLWAIKKKRNKQ